MNNTDYKKRIIDKTLKEYLVAINCQRPENALIKNFHIFINKNA